ncbi:hypothetical protein Tco_0241705 [Tanacetum coccineum]
MTTLKFADTHNMVAFLSKPAKSEGFEQIVDFLNAHPIKHTLTVNLTIYASCIEQLWATVKEKTINGEVQLQALVDGKKIVITESTVRRDLQLEDAEGVDFLPNATIFEQLALMRIYVTPSHTKKIFGNIRMVGKGFSGRETPLFPTMMVHNQEEMGAGSAIPTYPHHTPTFIQSSPQPQKTQKPRRPKKKDTQVPQSSVPSDNIVDEAVYKELDDSLVRAATTASSLEAEQYSGNIIKTQSKATPNEAGSQGTTSGGGPRSGEDSLKLNELMELCTNLQQRVLDLETTNTTQANEIASLKRRVNKLENKDRSRTHKLKRLYKGMRIHDIDADEHITLVNDDNEIFDADALASEEVFVAEQSDNVVEKVVDAAQTITTEEITLAKALADLKSTKPKAKGIVFREPGESTTTTTPIPSKIQDKGKGKMVEPEPMKKLSTKGQLKLHEEIALKLQAEIDEEERLAREKVQQIEKANIAWDDVQAKFEVDYQLAQRLQAQEQEELTDEEKVRLFIQFLEQRRKHFATKRAEEKRNRPPTRVQQRNMMCTYLKNMEGWKPKSLKNKSFANIQELFEKAMIRVNTFVDYRTELVEESSKKAETELEENLKKAEAEVMDGSSKRAGEEL